LLSGADVFDEDGPWSELQALPAERRCSKREDVVCRRNEVSRHAVERSADVNKRLTAGGALNVVSLDFGFIEGLSWWAVSKHSQLLCEGFVVIAKGINQEETSEQYDQEESCDAYGVKCSLCCFHASSQRRPRIHRRRQMSQAGEAFVLFTVLVAAGVPECKRSGNCQP
jgi:hypothetical protein